MKLKCYKSPIGVLIQSDGYSSYWDYYLLNGKNVESTFTTNWKILKGESEITSIKKKTTTHPETIGYSLIDSSLASENIPQELSLQDVARYYDDDAEGWRWSNYSTLRSLYEDVRSEIKVSWEDVDFEVEYLGTLNIDNVDDPVTTKVMIKAPDCYGWGTKPPVEKSIASLAEYNELTKAIVPDLVIHNQPCSISSPVAYQIVRAHVKNNIDLKNATITSDYDFCFTVKKKVAIKPVDFKNEIKTARGKSYRPPRYKTGTTTFKELEIFEMTHSKENYRGYTPIAPFQGDNLKELAENVQAYLDELMVYINTPFSECQHCKGTGHIVGDKFDKNKRSV